MVPVDRTLSIDDQISVELHADIQLNRFAPFSLELNVSLFNLN